MTTPKTKKGVSEKNMDSIWNELFSNFGVLNVDEKKAMIVQVAPKIIGIYKEHGYMFDGILEAEDTVKKIRS